MSPPTPAPPIAAERRLRRAAVALAAAPAIALVAAERFVYGDLAGFPLDDPWIHLTFARHLAAGDGLAYRAGELVAGSTAPLWTALLAFVALLPGPAEAWAKALGLAAHVAALTLLFRLARRFDLSPRRAAVVTLLAGLSEGLVLAAPSGMEVPLFVALFAAGLLRHLDERARPELPPLSFLLWALAALARPEGLLLPLLAAADRLLVADATGWRVDRAALRHVAAGLGVAALLLLPVGAAFAAMSGSPLPTTLAAKSEGPPAALPPLRHLAGVVELLFAAQAIPTLLAAAGAVELARRLGTPRDRGLLLPVWTVALALAVACLSGGGSLLAGNFGRYLFPLLPCVVLLGVVALDRFRFAELRTLRLAPRLGLPIGAVVLLALVAQPLVRGIRAGGLYLQARGNVEASDGRAADWLAARAPADALVATVDIGRLGWRLPNPLLDLGGIVSPERRELYAEAAARGEAWPAALAAWIEARHPEYVVVFPRWFPLLERQPTRYPPLARFRVEGNVAMAGDELVIYATPWTRAHPPAP
jgi:hypothetical protein